MRQEESRYQKEALVKISDAVNTTEITENNLYKNNITKDALIERLRSIRKDLKRADFLLKLG